ncbi:MAG: DUF748 domain-containing protein [Opitutaceae bacterium]
MPEPFSIFELRRQSGARARRVRRRRFLLIIGGVLLVLLGLAAAALIAPPLIQHRIERRLASMLHREVTLREVHLNPWALSVTLDGLSVNDRDNRRLFGFDRLDAKFDFWSLFSGPWILQDVSITAPTAHLEIDRDGAFNLSDWLASSAGPPAPTGKPRPIVLRRLNVTQARITFADHSHAQDFSTELGPLDFSLENFSTGPVAPGALYEFTASTASGESWHWRGTLSADPLRSVGEFSLAGIVLKKYAPYFSAIVHGDILDGNVDVAGRYEMDLRARPYVMKVVNGRLHLRDLQLASHGGSLPVVSLPAADLTGLEASLRPLRISAARLELTGGHVALQRAADGTLNLAEILAPPTAGAGLPVSPSAVPPDVTLAALAIHSLALTFDDATPPRPVHHTVASLDLSAQGISLSPGVGPVRLALVARFPPQGMLTLKGSVALAQCQADLAVELVDFPLAGVAPYFEPQFDFRLTAGTASARGRLVVVAPDGTAPQITYRGDAGVDRCSTVDGVFGEDWASCASLDFKQIEFTSTPLALAIGQVSLIEPSFRLTRYRGGLTNLDVVLRRAAPGNSNADGSVPVFIPGNPPPARAFPLNVDRVVLTGGSFTFTDRSIDPNATLAVGQVTGFVSGLSSEGDARAKIDLRGIVDNSAPATVDGRIGVFGRDGYADLVVGCSDLDLQPVNPYFGKYAGFTLESGSLSLDLKIHLDQRQLDSQNVVTLNQLTLGDRTNSRDATGLPVRFAVALLKDAGGKMVIDLPIQGRVDDPNFDVGRAVSRVISNLVDKTTAEPFARLGSEFGAGGQSQMDRIEFIPGLSEPVEAETQKLDVLARALTARPGLVLEIAGGADREADKPSLQREKLRQYLRLKIWESRHALDSALPPVDQIQISPEELNRALVSFYVMTFQHPAAPTAAKNAVIPVQQRHIMFQRSRDYYYNPTTASTQPIDSETPHSAAPTQPPEAMPSLQEMVTRLSVRQRIDNGDLRRLAADRAQAVKDYLVAQGVPTERILSANSDLMSAPAVMLRLK